MIIRCPARCRWEKPVTTISINGLPMSLAFHAYDPHLVIANESDMITYVGRYERTYAVRC